MSKAKIEAAKELIQEKRYDEAALLLQGIDDPLAKEWLAKLNDPFYMMSLKTQDTQPAPPVVAVPVAQPVKRHSGWMTAFAILVFACFGFAALSVIWPTVNKVAAGPTSTPGPSLTPSRTLTPSQTYTPSTTPTITQTPTITLTATDTLTPTITPSLTATQTPTATPTLSPAELTQTQAANITATRAQYNDNLTATADARLSTQVQRSNDQTATMQPITDSRTATADSIASTKAFIQSYKPIARGELVSYADNHIGEDVVVQGRVFSILDDSNIQIYLAGSNDVVYVRTAEPMTGIYKNDFVTVYGTVLGFEQGTNAFGATITLPVLDSAVVVK